MMLKLIRTGAFVRRGRPVRPEGCEATQRVMTLSTLCGKLQVMLHAGEFA